MKKILLLSTLMAFVFSVNAQSPIILSIKHKLGNQDYSENATVMADAGYEFNAKRIQYYISQIKITHDGGTVSFFDDNILVDANEDVIHVLNNTSITNFESISYFIGVKESLNHLDPALYAEDHPLAPQNPNMHWGWASGYKFIAMEGAAGDGLASIYQIHALGDQNYFETSPEANWYYQSQTSFAPIVVDIHANYINALQDIDVSTGLIKHGDTDEAIDLLVNFRDNVFGPGDGSPLSAEDILASNKMKILPNPATQFTTIHLDNYDGDFAMNIVDVSGKQILSKNMQSRDQVVDLSNFANGIYFVQLTESGKLVQTEKLVVTK